MPGEKYVVASADNPLQISVRNILNPEGYIFLGNCSDAISLLRLVRSYHPDFIVVDFGIWQSDARSTLETIDSEMLCASILLGDFRDTIIFSMMEQSNAMAYCPKPVNRDILLHTVGMTNMNYRRVLGLDKKLKEMTENYESRKLVERAKAILMERDGLTEKDAYDRMRKKSMDNRMTMKSVAEMIILKYKTAGKG
ncbi:MAG: ANTAR domain-containing protein [Clostridiaceae bacterium]